MHQGASTQETRRRPSSVLGEGFRSNDHLDPFQLSATGLKRSFDPTEMQPEGDQHDTPVSTPAVTVGEGTMVHVDPFQRSATFAKSLVPGGGCSAYRHAEKNSIDTTPRQASGCHPLLQEPAK
jgi:hypothetical protein